VYAGHINLGAESGGGQAHLNSGFAHTLECITTSFRWGTLVHQIAEDGCRGEDSEVYLIERLEARPVSI
jgi:hypothetical protein